MPAPRLAWIDAEKVPSQPFPIPGAIVAPDTGIITLPAGALILGASPPAQSKLFADFTQHASPAGSPVALSTGFNLPGGTLAKAGDAVRITAVGHVANNANAKSVILNIGASNPITLPITINSVNIWEIRAILAWRAAGVSVQFEYNIGTQGGTTPTTNYGVGIGVNADLSVAQLIQMTCTQVAAADVFQDALLVENLS